MTMKLPTPLEAAARADEGHAVASGLGLDEVAALLRSMATQAEPVAWLYETWCGADHWSQRYSDTKPAGNKWERNIRPLYFVASPQAQAGNK